MAKVRPIAFVMYRIAAFLGDAECYIYCYPQQKWDAENTDDGRVELSRKNVTFIIPNDDFNRNWKVVE